MTAPRYAVGQWVRWMRNGALVIGVVQYVRDQSKYPYEPEYVTDVGSVAESSILEAR